MNTTKKWFLTGCLIAFLWTGWLLGGVGSGKAYILSDPDAYLHAWNLWWVKTALVDLFHSPYWTGFNGYPATIPLTYHQLILPLGIASIPFWSFGFHAGQILALWQYTLPILGFMGAFLLIRRIGGSEVGACFGALYLLFTPIGWENLARPDSLSYMLLPWLVLAILKLRDYPEVYLPSASLLVCFFVLMSPYYAAGLGVLWLLSIPFCEYVNVDRKNLLLVYPTGVLLAGFEWIPQVMGENPNLVRPAVVEAFSADLSGIFLPHPHFWWVPNQLAFWSETWTAGIHSSIYPGWIALIVAVSALFTIDSSLRNWFIFVAGIFFLVSLGPGIRILGETYLSGFLPYGIAMSLFDQVRAFRIPLRFGYFLIFLIPLGVGIRLTNSWWSVALGSLLLIELIRPPMTVRPLPKVNHLQQVRKTISEPALVPIPLTDWASEAQFGQTIHRKKFPLEGVSYTPEPVWDVIGGNPVLEALFKQNDLPEQGWDDLRKMGFGGVIIHTKILNHERARKRLEELRKLLGKAILRFERFRVYRIKG